MNSNPARIESIVAAAVAKPAEERAAFLDKACGGDAELRRRVEALLLADAQAGSAPITSDLPAGQWIDRDATPEVAERPGTRVGRYKLLQQIGEGGMGTVYMAEQEKPVRRRVALKIIKPGMDSAQVIARFEVERQALAMMDHPNIAKVLDAGTTSGEPGCVSAGRPYFVMELVYGVPITKFCDDSQLTPRQRLELFVPVCQAIQHAHQKGIIHRDIKPSNVLVTMHDDKPMPKVIDFGVAKAMEQHLTEKTLFTAFGTVVGTYEYMSPEQAEMNAFGVDTRSDVYSLGVLLYELLTGTTPLERKRLREAAFSEMVRLIKEVEPPRPSVRLSSSGDLPKIAAARKTDPGRLPSLLRGEIDWIVMRCLEKDRTRRYESASALARDVERYLNDEAVEACPPSVGYRLRKFARKYRAALVTASAFAAVLLIASGVSIWLAIAARQAEAIANDRSEEAEKEKQNAANQRDRAEREFQRAEKAAKAAEENAAQTGRALDRMTVAKGLQLAEEGKMFEALPWFVRPLERSGLTPEEEKVHRTRIAYYLRHTPGRPTLRQVLFPVGWVSHAAWSEDAKRVLTVSSEIVQVWDARSGELLVSLKHPELVTTAQFTPDGTRVLTASNMAVWNWDARSGRQLGPPVTNGEGLLQHPLSLLTQTPLQLLGNIGVAQLADAGWHDSHVSAEISRDGRRVLFTYRRHVRLVDLESRKTIGQWLRGAEWLINDHAISPNGQLLLLNRDGLVSVLSTGEGMKSGRSIDHGSPVESVAFSPDGTRALTIGKDWSLQVWDANTWKPLTRMSGHDSVRREYAEFSPDNRYVAVWGWWIGGLRDLALWDVVSGRLIHEAPENDLSLQLSWKPDSQQFLCTSGHGDVVLWDVSKRARPTTILLHGRGVQLAVYGPDARMLLTATSDGEVRIWDLSSGYQSFALKPLEKDAAGTSMQLVTATGSTGRSWSSLNTSETDFFVGTDQEQIKRFLPPRTRFNYAILSQDRSRVLTSHLEGKKTAHVNSVQLWDVRTGRQLGNPIKSTSNFNCAAFSGDSRLIVTASDNGTINICDARTGTLVGHPLEHGGSVLYAAFSPDGELLVTCGNDQSARLWSTRTGQPVGEKLQHEDAVALAAFSANGKIVATASMDGIIRLWDDRGASLGMLKTKNGYPQGLLFHTSRLLLAAFAGDKMRVWNIASQQEASPVMAGHSNILPVYRGKGRPLGGMLVRNRDFDPPSDDRPIDDLVKLGQLYFGRHLDANGGIVPLPKDGWRALWLDLHAKYPAEFAVSSQTAVDWRIQQIQSARTPGRRAAIAFHLRWLAAELTEAGWQPSERGDEDMDRLKYLERLYALALHGRHTEATAAADVLAARWPKDRDILYNCACFHALAAGAVKGDAALTESYAVRAVTLLQQAVAAGFNNGPHMLKDSDLDALRQRNDFQMLLKKLTTKQP